MYSGGLDTTDRDQFIAIREQIFGDSESTGDAYAEVKQKLPDFTAFHKFLTQKLIEPIFEVPVCGDGLCDPEENAAWSPSPFATQFIMNAGCFFL